MASNQPFELRWGIISTGKISRCFVRDLQVNPKSRNVHDVRHKVIAVGSRNLATAEEFANVYDRSIKAYGSYADVYADKVGTPHTYHYENALDAIKAKKHVLCEKPVTLNAAELRSLLDAAKKQGVFFMEALWTRFQPLTLEVKKIAESGVLGEPVALQADLSSDCRLHELPKTHRLLDPYLGGGALLDLGPYPLVWILKAILALYEHPSNKNSRPSQVTGAMLKTRLTGVDRSTSFIVTFDAAPSSASNTLATQATGVVIRYERGVIVVTAPIYCPKSFTVQYYAEGKPGVVVKEETRRFEYVGTGMHFEADEVARSENREAMNSHLVSRRWYKDPGVVSRNALGEQTTTESAVGRSKMNSILKIPDKHIEWPRDRDFQVLLDRSTQQNCPNKILS
ncbi:hypothetical protein V8B97DRAFT_1916838 [Scleroderma yunnanense]